MRSNTAQAVCSLVRFPVWSELKESERHDYLAAAELAREQRFGLWTEPDPMPPSECRKLRRAGHNCR